MCTKCYQYLSKSVHICHTCVSVYLHVQTTGHVFTQMHICICVCIHICIHIHVQKHVHIYTHACIYMYIYTNIHTHVYTQMHMHIHTYIFTLTLTRVHTYKYTCYYKYGCSWRKATFSLKECPLQKYTNVVIHLIWHEYIKSMHVISKYYMYICIVCTAWTVYSISACMYI